MENRNTISLDPQVELAAAGASQRCSILLECLDEFILVLREDAAEDRELLRRHGGANRPG